MSEVNTNTEEALVDSRLKNAGTINRIIMIPEGEASRFQNDSLYYDMSGKKYLIIINQHIFEKTEDFNNKQPATRHGTEKDVARLEELFRYLRFDNIMILNNRQYEEIMRKLTEFALGDHSKTSCIFVTILSHGDKEDVIYAADKSYKLSNIMNLFDSQPSLVKKPKVYFVQACRGEGMDSGYKFQLGCDAVDTVQLDSDNPRIVTVPSNADYLVLRSTVEDYLSYRHPGYGTWMIQDLCDIIYHNHKKMDLNHMLHLVNRKVSERVTTKAMDQSMNDKKQMSEVKHTMTKLIKL